MTRCARYEKLIQERIDGEITPGEARVLERHLQGCSRCREALRDYEWIAATLEAEPSEESAPLAGEVLARIEQRRTRARLRPALAAVAALVVAAVALLLLSRFGREASDQQTIVDVEGPAPMEQLAFLEFVELDPPRVFEQSELFLAENVRTLTKDAVTTREALWDALDGLARELPLI